MAGGGLVEPGQKAVHGLQRVARRDPQPRVATPGLDRPHAGRRRFERPHDSRPHGDHPSARAAPAADDLGCSRRDIVFLLGDRMPGIQLMVHVRREAGVQDDVCGLNAAPPQVEQQPPGKGAPGRRHLDRSGLIGVDVLVVVQVPRRRDVFVPDGAPHPVDGVDQVGPGLRETDLPEPGDLGVALVDDAFQPLSKAEFDPALQAAGEQVLIAAEQKRQPGIIGEMFGKADLNAGLRRRFAAGERCGQGPARVEDQQIAGAQVLGQPVESAYAPPCSPAGRSPSAGRRRGQPALLGRSVRRQLRGQVEREGYRHNLPRRIWPASRRRQRCEPEVFFLGLEPPSVHGREASDAR